MNFYLKRNEILFICIIFLYNTANGLTGKDAVQNFFSYFQKKEPLGIPVVKLEEPMAVFSPLEMIPITLINGKLLGHSKLKILQVYVDFLTLTGSAKVEVPRLELCGDYSWPGFYYSSEGFVNVTLLNVSIYANFSMVIDNKGDLQINEVNLNQESDESFVDMTNLIWEHDLIISSGAIEVFIDEISMNSFQQLEPFLVEEVNKELTKFINTLPDVETFLTEDEIANLIASGRNNTFEVLLQRVFHYVVFEPLMLPDVHKKIVGFNVKVNNMMLIGLSKIYKIKSLFIVYQEKILYMEAVVTYEKLLLFYKLYFKSRLFGNYDIMFQKNRLNNVKFNVRLTIDPSLKVPPRIKYLDIHVGSFGRLKRNRKSIWGKVLNLWEDAEDSVLREIVNMLEFPIKKILQNELNKRDIQETLLYLLENK